MSKLKRVNSSDDAAARDDAAVNDEEIEILKELEDAFAGGYSNKQLMDDFNELEGLSIEELDELLKENQEWRARIDEQERRSRHLRKQRLKAAKKRDREDDERRRREFEKRHRNKAKEDKTPLKF